MLAHVRDRLAVLAPDAHALVACSGGADSTALALLVRRARPDLTLTLAYVAHGLRGPGDDAADAAQVGAVASALGVDHVVLPVRVGRGGGVEAAARDARHAALEDRARAVGATAVLLGHHAEDQAETLLLRLARGTGSDGLAGMAPLTGRRVRPLLAVRRADVHRVAAAAAPGAAAVMRAARQDPMNDDDSFARVRVRHDVLPALARVGPDPVGALTRLADLARDETAALEAAADLLAASLPVVTVGTARAVPSAGLRAAAPAHARRVLRRLLGTGGAAGVERVLVAPDGWRGTVPGPWDVSVERGWHVLAPAAPATATAATAAATTVDAVTVSLRVGASPAEVHHAPSSLVLHAAGAPDGTCTLAVASPAPLPPGLDEHRRSAVLRVTGPLTVRTRRPGERVRLAAGSRPVATLLAEAGVPRALRDRLPVVADATDRVLWVPGVAVDSTVHVGPAVARH